MNGSSFSPIPLPFRTHEHEPWAAELLELLAEVVARDAPPRPPPEPEARPRTNGAASAPGAAAAAAGWGRRRGGRGSTRRPWGERGGAARPRGWGWVS
jgi:hypothetical protein